jgi:hypothetical protein
LTPNTSVLIVALLAKQLLEDMGFGIIEPKGAKHVPGTVLLDQSAAHSEGVTNNLKHAAGKDSNIILAPQPSEDPNDPLNWSRFKKNAVMAIVSFGVIVHGTIPVSWILILNEKKTPGCADQLI